MHTYMMQKTFQLGSVRPTDNQFKAKFACFDTLTVPQDTEVGIVCSTLPQSAGTSFLVECVLQAVT